MNDLNRINLTFIILILQVLSNSVSKALEIEGRQDTRETAEFCHIFNKFFDCLNVRCQAECVRRRKANIIICDPSGMKMIHRYL